MERMRTNVLVWQVPDYWKRYAHEVDQEREMWLNSFYKAPLRLPMPAELSYWWENGIISLSLVLARKSMEPKPINEDSPINLFLG
jgi:hypothetical protein